MSSWYLVFIYLLLNFLWGSQTFAANPQNSLNQLADCEEALQLQQLEEFDSLFDDVQTLQVDDSVDDQKKARSLIELNRLIKDLAKNNPKFQEHINARINQEEAADYEKVKDPELLRKQLQEKEQRLQDLQNSVDHESIYKITKDSSEGDLILPPLVFDRIWTVAKNQLVLPHPADGRPVKVKIDYCPLCTFILVAAKRLEDGSYLAWDDSGRIFQFHWKGEESINLEIQLEPPSNMRKYSAHDHQVVNVFEAEDGSLLSWGGKTMPLFIGLKKMENTFLSKD